MYKVRWSNVVERELLAWAAGLADGEGSFFRTNNGKTIQPSFSISQVDRRVLDRFAKAVGFGKVPAIPEDAPARKRAWANARPIYKWRCSGFERVQFLTALLWTWLGPVKREQAVSILF